MGPAANVSCGLANQCSRVHPAPIRAKDEHFLEDRNRHGPRVKDAGKIVVRRTVGPNVVEASLGTS